MNRQKICIIGNGLAGLVTAAVLSDENIEIDLIFPKFVSHEVDHRTTAISESNYNFLKKSLKLKNLNYIWQSKKIDLFYQRKEKFFKFLNFSEENKTFMNIFQNSNLRKTLLKIINKKKNIKIIKETVRDINFNKSSILIKNKNVNYDLLILSLGTTSPLYYNVIKNRTIVKNYKEIAITGLIKHKSKIEGASQFFLNEGPLAILPLKKSLFSIEWSVNENFYKKNKNNLNKLIFLKLKQILGKNFKCNIQRLQNFPIYLNLKRKYYKKNVLIIGDGLHRVHPVAGQGFNLALRDISKLKELIINNLRLGLSIKESSILNDFYKARKPENTIMSLGIDLTNSFFKEKKVPNPFKDLILENLRNSKLIKKISQTISDKGL